MSKYLSRILLLMVLLPVIAFAAEPTVAFQAGKDYEVLSTTLEVPVPKDTVHVTEFFNYGCPACSHFEPALEAWLAKKPKYIVFERVPVVFEPNWDLLARAYYTARTLGVAEKLTPALFAAIHKEGKAFNSETELSDFFAQRGVNKKDFDDAFNFSPGIDAQMLRGSNLMRKYKIMEVPTILVGNNYKVSPRMVNGDSKRLLQVVDYLVQKEKAGGH